MKLRKIILSLVIAWFSMPFEALLARNVLPILDTRVYVDRTSQLSVQNLMASDNLFEPFPESSLVFETETSVPWVRFEIGPTDTSSDWMLIFNDNSARRIDLYAISNGKVDQSWVDGPELPLRQRTTRSGKIAFPIRREAGKSQIYYARMESIGLTKVSADLEPMGEFQVDQNKRFLALGIYYGIVIALFLYNLFLYIATRDKSLLAYIIFIFACSIVLFTLDGQSDLYLHNGLFLWWDWIDPLANFAVVTAILFTRTFLQTRKYFRKLDTVLLTLCGLFIAATGGRFLYAPLSGYITDGTSFATGCILMFTGVYAMTKGVRQARFYILGWLVLIVFLMLWLGKNYGLVPINFVTDNGLHFGCALEMILMSLALADRINLLQDEKRSAEQQGRESAAVAKTMQMIAHDIRKPFTLINMHLDEISRKSFLHSSPVNLEIRKAVDKASGMFKDVLDISRDSQLECREVSVEDIIRDALLDVLPRFEDRKIEFQFDLNHKSNLSADSSKAIRIFTNIIENAIQALGHQGTIWIKSRSLKGFVEFSIGNDGPPIAEEVLPRIFEEFYTSGKGSGTGLGLAICKKIVHAHGTSIRAETRTDKTEFIFALPQGRLDADDAGWIVDGPLAKVLENIRRNISPPEKPLQVRLGGADRLIILVEDSVFIRDHWRKNVENLIAFSCPREFWKAVNADPALLTRVFCVVTDYIFENDVTTGAEFAEQVSERFDLPIILSTNAEIERSSLPKAVAALVDKTPLSIASIESLISFDARNL